MTVLDHEGLIVKIANQYSYFAERYSNVDREDLIQEGWVAVIRKHDDYYKNKVDCALSTYLTNWIQDGMRQYIKKRSVFRKSLSYRVGETLQNYVRIANIEKEPDNGEEPTSSADSLENLCTSSSPEEEIMALESLEEVLRAYTTPIDNNYRARRTNKYVQFKDLLEEELPIRRKWERKK